jgi:hypothetical protein
MTIRLTLDLPATAADLRTYAEMVHEIRPDLEVCLVGPSPFELCLVGPSPFELTATIGETSFAVVKSEPEPQPVKVPKADKRAARKAPAKAKPQGSDRRAAPGAVQEAIVATLDAKGGHWPGAASSLAREAWPSNESSAAKAILNMEREGLLTIERDGRMVRSVTLATAAPRRLAPVPDPAPAPSPTHPAARQPATPLPAPAGGIKEPAKGWA